MLHRRKTYTIRPERLEEFTEFSIPICTRFKSAMVPVLLGAG